MRGGCILARISSHAVGFASGHHLPVTSSVRSTLSLRISSRLILAPQVIEHLNRPWYRTRDLRRPVQVLHELKAHRAILDYRPLFHIYTQNIEGAMKIHVGRRLLKIRKLQNCLSGKLPSFLRRMVHGVQQMQWYSQSLALIRQKFGRKVDSYSEHYPQVVRRPLHSLGKVSPKTRTRDHSVQPNRFSVDYKEGNFVHFRRKIVPQGFVAIYVGEEQKRFVIPIVYLYHPFITRLLMEAENAFGYDPNGPLRVPCHVEDFEQLKWLIDREKTVLSV
eukprot:Gb_39146 [translate_table: standard]